MSKRYDVQCRFGKLALIPTTADHICATSNPEGGANFLPFTIRGVEYSVTAHLYRYADGSWHVGEEKTPEYQRLYHGLYMNRRHEYSRDTSQPARTAAAAEIETVVNAWVSRNGKSLTFAQFSALENELARLMGDRQELAAKLSVVDDNIKKTQAKLARLK